MNLVRMKPGWNTRIPATGSAATLVLGKAWTEASAKPLANCGRVGQLRAKCRTMMSRLFQKSEANPSGDAIGNAWRCFEAGGSCSTPANGAPRIKPALPSVDKPDPESPLSALPQEKDTDMKRRTGFLLLATFSFLVTLTAVLHGCGSGGGAAPAPAAMKFTIVGSGS
jgi:hypothetical protein